MVIIALIFLYLFQLIQYVQSQEVQQLNQNTPVEFRINFNTYKYFQIAINEVIEGQDLAVIANPLDFRSDPDIYIAPTSQQNLPSMEHFNEFCNEFYRDVCYIPNYIIKTEKSFNVGIYCKSLNGCSVQLLYQYEQESTMNLGQQKYGDFSKDQDIILKVYVPEDPNIEYFIFELKLLTVKHDVSMFVGMGQEVPGSNQLPVFITSQGHLFTASQNDRWFCKQCYYTIKISSSNKQGTVLFTTRAQHLIQKIQMNDLKQDAMISQKNITYMFDTNLAGLKTKDQKINEQLEFTLDVYQGNPYLYVNCQTLPSKLEDFEFDSNDNLSKNLIITAEEFQKIDKCDIIYILVFAQTCSSFSLKIKNIQENVFPIESGVVESGYLENNDVMNFIYQTDSNQSFVINLFNGFGNPDLYLFKCQSSDNCSMTNQSIIDQSYKTKNLVQESKSPEFDQITVNNNDDCKISNKCIYLITVFANPEPNHVQNNQTHFRLFLNQARSVMVLKENSPHRMKLRYNEWDYFVYTLIDDEGDIKSVSFQATILHGDPDIFVSRQNQPDFRSFEKAACFCQNLVTFQKNIDGKLQSTYYISVFGMTDVEYTLNVILEREKIVPIQLYNGLKQKLVLINNDVAYFQFHQKSSGVVSFRLEQIKGTTEFSFLQGNLTMFQKEENVQWFSNDQSVHSESGIYTIAVRPIINQPLLDDYQFNFQVESGFNMKKIIPGKIQSISVVKGQNILYSFEVLVQDIELSFSLNQWDRQIKFHILNGDEILITENSGYLSLDEAFLKKNCQNSFLNGQTCFLLINFETNSDQIVQSEFLLQKQQSLQNNEMKQSIIELKNGYSIKTKAPVTSASMKDQIMRMTLRPLMDKTTTVEFYSKDAIVLLKAKVISSTSSQQMAIDDKNFPSYEDEINIIPSNYSFQHISSVTLYSSNYSKCTPNCIVTFVAIPIKIFNNNSTFNIQVVPEIIQIYSNQVVNGKLDLYQNKYFNINITKLNDNLIYLNTYMDVDIDLVLMKGQNSRPDQLDYDFIAKKSSNKQSHFEIYPNLNETGLYTIGILGGEKGIHFELSFSNNKMISIQEGSISETTTDEDNQIVYFEYIQKNQQDINFAVLKKYGFGIIYLNTQQLDQVIDQKQLPGPSNYLLKFKDNELGEFIGISQSDSAYCVDCRYLLAYYANVSTSLGISIVSQNQTVYIKEDYSVLRQQDFETVFNYYVSSYNDQIILQFDLQSGDNVTIKAQSIGFDQAINHIFEKSIKAKFVEVFDAFKANQIQFIVTGKSSYYLNVHKISLMGFMKAGLIYPIVQHLSQRNVFYWNIENNQQSLKLFSMFVDQIYNEDISKLLNISVVYSQTMDFRSLEKIPLQIQQHDNIYEVYQLEKINKSGYFILEIEYLQPLLNFNIVRNTRQNLVQLPQNSKYSAVLLKSNEYKNQFQIFVEEDGYLSIQLQNCYGEFFVNGTNQYEKIEQNDFDLNIIESAENQIFMKAKVTKGNYFLQVSIKNKVIHEDIFEYKIETKFYIQEYNLPLFGVFLMKQGDLHYTIQNEEVDVFFEGIGFDDQNIFTQVTQTPIQAQILVSDDIQAIRKQQRCGIISQNVVVKEFLLEQNNISQEQKFVFALTDLQNEFKHQNKLYFNILTKFQDKTMLFSKDLQIQLNYSQNESTVSQSVVYAIIIILCILVIIVAYIYRRYLKIKQRLHYELNEVRDQSTQIHIEI